MDPMDIFQPEIITTYGIIGDPVEHSLSPQMHNAAFAALEVDAEYVKIPVREDDLDQFFQNLKKKESPIFGLNVTVPHKQGVLKYLDVIDPFAEKVQAVNTIVIGEDRQLKGYNTDGPGFLLHLQELGFDPAGKRISIVGAGGTTRAILTSLCLLENKPERILIYNRTAEKLNSLIKELALRLDISIIEVVAGVEDLNVELADLLINTTSLGLKEDDPAPINPELFHANLLSYDVVYNPEGTRFLKYAQKAGAKTANGLGMLFYQGILAFQHWAEMEVQDELKDIMRRALMKGYEK